MNKKKSSTIKVISTGNRTSFQLNPTTLIDAGSLMETLNEESAFINKIFLTHSHLDHIVDIAFMLDDYFELREETLEIIGLRHTIDAIKRNFLNDIIWPDFSNIKLLNSEKMAVKYTIVIPGETYTLSTHEKIELFSTDHTVESCGYIYKVDKKAILVASDTYSLDSIIKVIEENSNVKSVVLECSFPNYMQNIAKESKHLTPNLLFKQLKNCKRNDFKLFINHVKPTYEKIIAQEIEQNRADREIYFIKNREILYF